MRRMAEELIKRADVLRALYNLPENLVNGREILWAEIIKTVCNIPSVKEIKHPKEEGKVAYQRCCYDPVRKIHIYICTNCGYRSIHDFVVCPKCNAQMRE